MFKYRLDTRDMKIRKGIESDVLYNPDFSIVSEGTTKHKIRKALLFDTKPQVVNYHKNIMLRVHKNMLDYLSILYKDDETREDK